MISLIIEFSDGRKSKFPARLNEKIMKIHEYLMAHGDCVGEYQLMAGYPPQPLSDPSKTFGHYGLKTGVTVTQKLIEDDPANFQEFDMNWWNTYYQSIIYI